ncbi:fructuronate reductase [Geodermatophilus amargosae]|uniref:Mannitol-1-phosphate 5-dehydrogenase n=1 Tax=Geodermatophilus amargosae TaxID=1296565 RepID=A0A1I7CCA9_9ACTN|nr:mannitol dehydrogenase family protein [Geodermatophilus amargosae]SFT97024.1 fructuronate reductase [Geodermatophilus amargosae]
MAQLERFARRLRRTVVPAQPAAEPVARVRPLTSATLEQHGTRLTVPTYDRAALTPAVVHLSVGGFSRAHQLIYFDEVAQRRISSGWGVVGVGLRARTLQEALAPQDNLYTVVERSPDGERARVVGVLTDYLFAPDAPGAVLDRLAHPAAARTVFGFLVEALDRRRRAGTAPFTVVSCDNLHRNGDATRAAVVGFAALRDEVLARWIADRVAFPSSMVDRITPQTTPEERAAVARRHRVDDRWPVITEPFSQWVIEDTFCNGRPPLDQVGVRFVRDVTAHELMKTRLLNASHSALGYLGTLAGHERIDVLMGDPLFAAYVTRLMDDEVTPLIPVPEGIDLAEYKATLLQRFANPAIADRLSRLCRRGSTKLPHHLLPSLRQALAEGRPHALLTLALAGWVRYLQRVDDDGRPLPVEDDRGPHLQALALAGGTDPRPLLAEESVFGDLGSVPGFADELAGVLRRLERDGVRATVAAATRASAR